ncbi:MAG TPA: sigma 54-interacting transcriptional regulator [Blastocatellia bacterium]|nr:sigma 54-interacting transcriptional regulator [Blastocatellia bacterium]
MSDLRTYQSVFARHSQGRRFLGTSRTAFLVLIFAAGYSVAYRYLTFPFPDAFSPFWAPDAILLCALLLSPPRKWALYVAVSLAARLFSLGPDHPPAWIVFASWLNDVGKALLTATVMRRFASSSARLASLRDFSLFFACAVVVAPALSAFGGAGARYAQNGIFSWHVWESWFLGNVLVNLVLTPTVLYWMTGRTLNLAKTPVYRYVEAVFLTAALVFIGIQVLGGSFEGLKGDPALIYIPMPFLLWAAVRFGPRGASLSLSFIALLSFWYAMENRGPFSSQPVEQTILSLQLFLIFVSTPLLFLAVLVQERREVEESLRESESRYRQMFEQNPAVQWLIDPGTGAIVAANTAASEFYGYPLRQLERMSVTDINTLPAGEVVAQLRRGFNRECSYFNFRHRLASGELRDVEVYYSPSVVGGRELLHEIIHDVTERRLTVDRFRRFFDLPLVGMAVTSADRRFTLVNQKLCDILGYSVQELTGMSWVAVTHPDDVDENSRLLQLTISGETEGYSMDKRFIHRNGGVVYATISARCVRRDDKAIDYLVLIVQDTTERTLAEAALREAEARNQAVFKAIPDLMFLLTKDGVYLDYHAKDPADLLLPPEAFIGKHISNVLPAELAERLVLGFEQAQQSDEPVVDEFLLPISGQDRYFESRMVTCDDDRILAIVRDITERVQAEDSIRKSGERFRQLADNIDSTFFVVERSSAGSKIIYVSPAYETIWGRPRDGLYRNVRAWLEGLHPEDRDRVASLITSSRTMRVEAEYRVFRPDGRMRWVHQRVFPIPGGEGEARRFAGVVDDITDRKLAEESLEQALAEVRQLKDQLYAENVYLQEAILVAHDFGEMVGDSDSLKRVMQQAEQVAPLDTSVLILGETGTGKELLAHAIHNLSSRKDRPLVTVNCAALPPDLIEDELFGHEKGAFTGAVAKRVGRFEIASGGTIFLDEIGELEPDLQVKLLRIIQEGEFERLGSSRTIKVDVRLIAATNRDLGQAVRAGTFRADLFYRLSVYPITVPPLRERREDIPPLVMHFVKQMNARLGKQIQSIPQRSLDALLNYSWPGNIRELRNVIERAAIITPASTLLLQESPGAAAFNQPLEQSVQAAMVDWSQTLEEGERNLIVRTLGKTGGKIEGPAGAAALLAIHPSTLRSRMRKLGIVRTRFMTPGAR